MALNLTPDRLGHIDDNNSTTSTLGISGVFTGTATEILKHGTVFVNVYSDVASATNGLSIQQSSDGTNWDHTDDYTVPAATGKNYSINPHAKFFRIVYTNGATGQSTFRLQTVHKPNSKPSSHRIKDNISGDDDATLSKSAITGEDTDGSWYNVQVTGDGNLATVNKSNGLSIAVGEITGYSFVHKFGNAPDFDTTDGSVTIWDGANDAGINAMTYTYSSSADIGLLSSSNAGDTQNIEIQGLDGSGNLVTQTITLNGQTDVDISAVGGTDLKRAFRMINVGSTDIAGVVYLRTNGSTQTGGVPDTSNTVRAVINNGNNQTLMGIYSVPTGKTAYVRSWFAATAGANKNSNYVVDLFARPSGQVFQLKHRSAISDAGSSHVQHMYVEPEVFTAGTDIEMKVEMKVAGGTAASISAGFDIVLIDD